MDKKQNGRRRETAAAKPQESWAVQPGAGSEDAGAKEGYLMGGGGLTLRRRRWALERWGHRPAQKRLVQGGAKFREVWSGEATPEKGGLRGRRGLGEPPQRRRARGDAGSGEARSRRRAPGRRAAEEARSE